MTITTNDPKLTAFVLGELSAEETAEIQSAIESDAEVRTEVEHIRQTVADIESAMQNEPLPIQSRNRKIANKAPASFRVAAIAVAASILIAVLVVGIQQSQAPKEIADPGLRLSHEIADSESSDKEPLMLLKKSQRIESSEETVADFSAPKNKLEEEFDTSKEAAADFSAPAAIPALDVDSKPIELRAKALSSDLMEGSAKESPERSSDYRARSSSSARSTITRGSEKSLGKDLSVQGQSLSEMPPIILSRRSILPHPEPNNEKNEAYKEFTENEFQTVKVGEFSTFSIDVDTAAYSVMRRYINEMEKRPPVESVRLEEYINYFKYDYAAPTDGKPFAAHVDLFPCPWNTKHRLARIGIKGKEYSADERPPLNLVFLVDVSGSMAASNRLPLVKKGLTDLVEMLQAKDRVAIVTYAGESRVALPSVSGQEKRAILDSINSLDSGGSTAGAAGIKTAYEVARKYYDKTAQNRVILCTDGDFNVGETNNKTLEELIGDEAKSGVFLTILGYGMGNYKDDRLKTLSMRGNGNYGYIDTPEESRKLLVEGLTGTLFAIAKDVKIQVDFNPSKVSGYRLLGYENRKLRDEDFHNDKVDAGEIGSGHCVTALYEIIPFGESVPTAVDKSRYAAEEPKEKEAVEVPSPHGDEWMFVKLRYKEPDSDKSSLLEYPVKESDSAISSDFQFAASAALYGMLLRSSRHSGDGSWDKVLELATPNVKDDPYRKEFVELVKKAKEFSEYRP